MVPKRVMRLKLSPDNQAIQGAMPLDVANPAFTALGGGAVAGDFLYFVANRQDALYDSHGVLTDAASAEPVKIFKSNARFAWGQAGAMKTMAPIEAAKPGTFKKAPSVPPPPANDDKH
jgi:hypothetical protein